MRQFACACRVTSRARSDGRTPGGDAMRTRLWILVLSGMGVGSPAWADDSVARAHQAVLDRAVILAGLQFTRPPLVLTSTLPWTASAGAEAWTTCDADDH